jgi:phytoene synthase
MNAKAQQYCQQHVYQRGNSLYYSLLFSRKSQKQSLIALHAFHQAIRQIPYQCSETQTALQKADWWQQEIDNLYEKAPKHPIGEALLPAITNTALPKRLLRGMIDGIKYYLQAPQINTNNDLILHCHQTTSLREMAASYILLDNPEQEALTFARDLGVVNQMSQIIAYLGYDIRQGILWLPQEMLANHHLDFNDLKKLKTTKPLIQVLNELTQQVDKIYRDSLQKTDTTLGNKLLPILTHATLAKRRLQEIQRDDFPVLEKQYTLTALQKFKCAVATAWRQRAP